MLFRTSCNADILRATRLWIERHNILDQNGDVRKVGVTSCIGRSTSSVTKEVRLKSNQGRGRKRETCVEEVHIELRDEFDRMRKLGVRFNMHTLSLLAQIIIANNPNGVYGKGLVGPRTGKKQEEIITSGWIQTFRKLYRIVIRTQSGKLNLNP